MMNYSVTTRSPEQTARLAAYMAPQLRPGDVIALVGNLAAGKTTFVQGLAAALEAAEYVASPTFTYINEYSGRGLRLIHIDAYRLHRGEELIEMGLWDYMAEDAVILIEWADNVMDVLPRERIQIQISQAPSQERTRDFQIVSPRDLELPA